MRVPILLVCSAVIFNAVQAEPLSDADRETLLESLEKLRETANSTVDARYRLAIGAYRNAMGSDDAAMDLYLKCIEKTDFEDQQKKNADFREWKRREEDKLSDPGFRTALRYQLRWLVLTLQASSEKADRAKLAVEAQEIVDAIFQEADKLKSQERLLGQSVLSSVFARTYDISSVKVEKWAFSPVQLESVYENILLAPSRKAGYVPGLRATWIKRIQQARAMVEHWSENPKGNPDDKKIGMAVSQQPPELAKFLEETQPKLQWAMEVDLFSHGDQAGAAVRMLAHLEKHINHASAREWSDQFKKLLTPAPSTANAEP